MYLRFEWACIVEKHCKRIIVVVFVAQAVVWLEYFIHTAIVLPASTLIALLPPVRVLVIGYAFAVAKLALTALVVRR